MDLILPDFEPLKERLDDIVGVVLTHGHEDHIGAVPYLLKLKGDLPLIGSGLTLALTEAKLKEHRLRPYTLTVKEGQVERLGPFELEFFGGKHAVIHESIPVIDNVGVLVNDRLYYPGDSYEVPEGRNVKLLAAPVGAPWLKIGEAMDFVLAVAPRMCFGTHDMTLSIIGRTMGRQRLRWATEQGGGEFLELDAGASVDI